MKPIPQFIECLEQRVAPAILVNGGNLLGGAGNPTTGETSSGGNTVTLVKVISGEALVFYNASNSSITEISVGKHTKLDITGNVGDIVTNLGPDGRLTDSDGNPANGEDGGILLGINLKGLTTHPLGDEPGSVGRIIAGGSIKNLNIAGTLHGVYAGDGIFKTNNTGVVNVSTGSVDYNTINPGLDNVFFLSAANAQSTATASIKKVSVGLADQLQVFAGDGAAPGSPGGDIVNVNIAKSSTSDLSTPAIFLHAGDGATGTNGGAGGSITRFTDQGSTSFVKLQTGDGGIGTIGGAGGSFTNSLITSDSLQYQILVGKGGAGDVGGSGGSVDKVTFHNAVSGSTSLIASGDFTGDGLTDVLLVNTVTGAATLSARTATSSGSTSGEAPFQVVFQPGNGSGLTPFIAPVGSVPTDVVATDVNGDGKLDFVVSYASSKSLGVFTNDGSGVFTASSVSVPSSANDLTVGNYLNNGHADIAVLSSGSATSASGVLASQIYLVANDGAGNFTTLPTPVTFSGIATDLASGQIDNLGGTDLIAGMKSGAIDTFLSTGSMAAAPFTLGTTFTVFPGGPITNLDAVDANTGVTLLAFTANSNATSTSSTAALIPQVQILNVSASGITSGQGFLPAGAPVAAHFIGSPFAIGVVSSAGISVYTNSSSGYATTVSLSSNGALSDFVSSSASGIFQIDAVGAAGSRFFDTQGDLSSTSGIGSLLPFDVPALPTNTTFVAGAGGAGDTHDGGKGGSITKLTYTQTLSSGVGSAGGRFELTVQAGPGGASNGGSGGRGGTLSHVSLSLDPADQTGHQDSTTFAILQTGAGGDGFTGGAGGGMSKVTSTTILNQMNGASVVPNAVAIELLSGNGGIGAGGAGGNGGDIVLGHKASLSGVSFFDPTSTTPFAAALVVDSGNGGSGATVGGDGGAISNIITQNAAASGISLGYNELGNASIVSGNGGAAQDGTGGRGGAITGLNVAVQSQTFTKTNDENSTSIYHTGGSLVITSGAGGVSANGVGGAGGTIGKSTVAAVDGDGGRDQTAQVLAVANDPYQGIGLVVTGGAGGAGTAGGGNGGAITKTAINSPSAPDVYGAVLRGGAGGDATVSGAGGKGGSIQGITQTKDVNSSISVLQGGNGGAGLGAAGGIGGSVKNIDTVGFIGLPATDTAPLGVFNDAVISPLVAALYPGGNIPQGIFAGRGADGEISGSVINVVARQIAAIGASVDGSGLFGVADTVTNVQADLIGYEVTRDNVFTSTVPGASPSQAQPVDGFILGATVSNITTVDDARTAAFTFNG